MTYRGHCDSSFVHHVCLTVRLTELGSMLYWAETEERRRAEEATRADAVKLFMMAVLRCVVCDGSCC